LSYTPLLRVPLSLLDRLSKVENDLSKLMETITSETPTPNPPTPGELDLVAYFESLLKE